MSLACAAVIALACTADSPRLSAAILASQKPTTASADLHRREEAPLYGSFGKGAAWREPAAARALLDRLANASADGLDPSRYSVGTLASRVRRGPVDADLDLALSRAWTAYLHDLRTPTTPITYVDAALEPANAVRTAVTASHGANTPSRLAAATRMHPLYQGLRTALAEYRRTGRHPSDLGGTEYARLLLRNMDRLRALPPDPAQRHVLVDTASARLWLYENGVPVDTMRVVVGKERMQTPALAGLIRFAVLRPYWNLPPDLARERAARAIRDGAGLLQREHLELLSGWEPDARVLDPLDVDWPAIAAGVQPVRMRQLPGPHNMMGAVKFMLPNRLGIYLHDTPDKRSFERRDRRLSSGCVRVEDAARLFRWLFGRPFPTGVGSPEQEVALSTPVPVFIVHLTALPENGRIRLQQDAYHRDRT